MQQIETALARLIESGALYVNAHTQARLLDNDFIAAGNYVALGLAGAFVLLLVAVAHALFCATRE